MFVSKNPKQLARTYSATLLKNREGDYDKNKLSNSMGIYKYNT